MEHDPMEWTEEFEVLDKLITRGYLGQGVWKLLKKIEPNVFPALEIGDGIYASRNRWIVTGFMSPHKEFYSITVHDELGQGALITVDDIDEVYRDGKLLWKRK